MREIKFRAWDTIHKKWYTRVQVGTNCCNSVYDDERQMWLEFDEICGVVMQYTGLKDKNGKEIYEGDVMKCFDADGDHEFDCNSAVEFYQGYWYAVQAGEAMFWLVINERVEVIGNIYENPELMKGAST